MVEFKKVLITPTYAKQLLEANIANRRVKEPVVMQYSKDIIEGRWKEDTGEVIKIFKSGKVGDGQHRLLAIIKANKPVYMHIATNVDDEVFDVLDTGSGRNSSDAFRIMGIKNENKLPSIIQFYNLLLSGKRVYSQKGTKPTNTVLLDQYYSNEKLWQEISSRSFTWYIKFAKILPPSYFGGFYAFFLELNSAKAEEFMEQLSTGINITNPSINLLRNKLMQDKLAMRKMPATTKIALIIKTWNLFVKNQTVQLLKFDNFKEAFPIATAGPSN
jgi:hypothetical protein